MPLNKSKYSGSCLGHSPAAQPPQVHLGQNSNNSSKLSSPLLVTNRGPDQYCIRIRGAPFWALAGLARAFQRLDVGGSKHSQSSREAKAEDGNDIPIAFDCDAIFTPLAPCHHRQPAFQRAHSLHSCASQQTQQSSLHNAQAPAQQPPYPLSPPPPPPL